MTKNTMTKTFCGIRRIPQLKGRSISLFGLAFCVSISSALVGQTPPTIRINNVGNLRLAAPDRKIADESREQTGSSLALLSSSRVYRALELTREQQIKLIGMGAKFRNAEKSTDSDELTFEELENEINEILLPVQIRYLNELVNLRTVCEQGLVSTLVGDGVGELSLTDTQKQRLVKEAPKLLAEFEKRLKEIEQESLEQFFKYADVGPASEVVGDNPKYYEPSVSIPWLVKLHLESPVELLGNSFGDGFCRAVTVSVFSSKLNRDTLKPKQLALLRFLKNEAVLNELEVGPTQKGRLLKYANDTIKDFEPKFAKLRNSELENAFEFYQVIEKFDESYFAKINGILNDDQQKRFEQLHARFLIRCYGVRGLARYSAQAIRAKLDRKQLLVFLNQFRRDHNTRIATLCDWYFDAVRQAAKVDSSQWQTVFGKNLSSTALYVDVMYLRLRKHNDTAKKGN